MKYLLFLLLVLVNPVIYGQGFYDMGQVQTIEVTFEENNWDQLMDNAYAAESGYILAESVTINGVTFDSIGVKYKGNSSYRSTQVKNPWHIELDTYKDQEYEGYTDIKLANGYNDPSFLRDVLGFQVVRQYMDAPLANFAELYVNGNLIGLYSNVESISKKFVNKRFGSKDNAFFKCSPPDGAGPQSSDYPNLVYMGQDSTDYYDSYELKSDKGWQEFINLCDTLSNETEVIEKLLDVDRALWMLAFNNTIVNLDSYIGAFAQNYYLYKDDHGRFLPVVWDLNESFGVFSMTGTISLNNTTSKQQMTHLLHENDRQYPLVEQLLNIPTYKRMYLAHMKTMLLENFDNGTYYDAGLALQTVIDDAVQKDQNKFFTYNNFTSNLTSDITAGRRSTPGITNLMDNRSDYLLRLNDFSQVQPSIEDIQLSNNTPVINEVISITASITDENTAFLGYRNEASGPFTKLEMYDDGAHSDGAANDGVYGVDLPVTSTLVQYYLYAENDGIGKFSPERAQYEYYEISASRAVGDLVINEFMASNDVTVADQDGEFDDWIELYNNGDNTIDLSGYYLSDDVDELTQWTFPQGTEIEADGYLIIWADGDIDQEGLHADFKLSAGGETIYLSDASQTIIDEVVFADQMTDVAFARLPNGTGDFQFNAATFNANNESGEDCTGRGGDMDNDGVCADDDCDDNDASVGASQPEGTPCDDGNAMTENDVILADGCTCEGTPISMSDVVINELMASNEATVADQDGEFDDWIELYNNGTKVVDLSGYFLTDDASELDKWAFPDGTEIEPDGYLIIWADEDLDQEGLHADLKLSASGESLLLVDPSDMSVVDAIDFGEQDSDISFGRYINGTGDFQFMDPTFNAENSGTTSSGDFDNEIVDLAVFPNPANAEVTVVSSQKIIDLSIYTLSGQKLLIHNSNEKEFTLPVGHLVSGVYVMQLLTETEQVITRKLIIEN